MEWFKSCLLHRDKVKIFWFAWGKRPSRYMTHISAEENEEKRRSFLFSNSISNWLVLWTRGLEMSSVKTPTGYWYPVLLEKFDPSGSQIRGTDTCMWRGRWHFFQNKWGSVPSSLKPQHSNYKTQVIIIRLVFAPNDSLALGDLHV